MEICLTNVCASRYKLFFRLPGKKLKHQLNWATCKCVDNYWAGIIINDYNKSNNDGSTGQWNFLHRKKKYRPHYLHERNSLRNWLRHREHYYFIWALSGPYFSTFIISTIPPKFIATKLRFPITTHLTFFFFFFHRKSRRGLLPLLFIEARVENVYNFFPYHLQILFTHRSIQIVTILFFKYFFSICIYFFLFQLIFIRPQCVEANYIEPLSHGDYRKFKKYWANYNGVKKKFGQFRIIEHYFSCSYWNNFLTNFSHNFGAHKTWTKNTIYVILFDPIHKFVFFFMTHRSRKINLNVQTFPISIY